MSKKDDALKLLEALVAAYRGQDKAGQVIEAITAIREALADHTEQPLEMVAEQPAQGCGYCSHPQYAGTKCKNCGREQPAQQQEDDK